ncbi:TPA: DUF2684 family protein [Klebsiella variicola]|nr:DUF2684 family protein [Klebsiella variicola]
MSVNQYRRINFWMAILGQFLSPFPAFFDGGRIYGKTRLANFPDNHANAHIFILLFTLLLGIKRCARLIKKAHGASPCGATSSRVKQSVFTESRSGVAPVARYV